WHVCKLPSVRHVEQTSGWTRHRANDRWVGGRSESNHHCYRIITPRSPSIRDEPLELPGTRRAITLSLSIRVSATTIGEHAVQTPGQTPEWTEPSMQMPPVLLLLLIR